MALPTKTYCSYVAGLDPDDHTNPNVNYHNLEYGYPLHDDNQLFGRLILEINQAGLSWVTILKKKDNFFKAYDNFQVHVVAEYGEKEKQRLLNDAGIIRNRKKIEAAIHNANVVLQLQKSHGSFHKWLATHHPKPKEQWVKLFKETFTFTGGEIVNEFLMSTGWLPGAHIEKCPIYAKILQERPPPWISTSQQISETNEDEVVAQPPTKRRRKK